MAKDVSWEFDRDFVNEATGIVVRVNVLPLFYPQYSMEVGVKSPSYDSNRFLLRHIKASSLSEHDLSMVLAEVIFQAQTHIQEKVSARHESIAAEQAEKAKKEADKRARHQANFEARRENNRAMAMGKGQGKGKK